MTGLEKEEAEATERYIKGLIKISMDAKTIAVAFEMRVQKVEAIIEKIQKEQGKLVIYPPAFFAL